MVFENEELFVVFFVEEKYEFVVCVRVNMDRDFLCLICFYIMKDVFFICCGYNFCYLCIMIYLKNRNNCFCCV